MSKKCKFVLFFCAIAVSFIVAVNVSAQNATPPNDAAIVQKLMKEGKLGFNASEEQIREALKAYYQQKLVFDSGQKKKDKVAVIKSIRTYNQRKAALRSKVAQPLYLENLIKNITRNKTEKVTGMVAGKAAGRVTSLHEAGADTKTEMPVKQVKLLVLLAEFANDEHDLGPLHNEIVRPESDNNRDLWVEDFGTAHYNKMLFARGGYDAVDQNGDQLHLSSMIDFYWEQSGKSMEVGGEAYGWFTLPHSEAYYGDDNPDGGIDNMPPGTPRDLVADLLVEALAAGVPFADFDSEDPFDIDGDGELSEPDGIIDHLVIVHAGVDQSGGGGAQGDNAIWAHSASVWEMIPVDNPPVDYWDGNMVAYNYIVQGEDGGIGVFCHEFGHDLGLPDEYDTKYSGNGEPVGFYSLMSSGSWTGKPLGTRPSPFSPFAKITLQDLHEGNWVDPYVVDSEDIKHWGIIRVLDESTKINGRNDKVIQVNLPQHKKDMTAPYDGSFEFYAGKGSEIDHTMSAALSLPASAAIELNFYTSYKIEEGWDFGFVQISVDEGQTWTSLESPRTTSVVDPGAYPDIVANVPGYTGDSGGWVNEIIDITEYAGQDIILQIRYMTDWATEEEGFFVDAVNITADGVNIFSDHAEEGGDKWLMDGWNLSEGFEWKDHYYLLEWRAHRGVDKSQKYCYTYKNSTNTQVQFYKNGKGLMVWYRDTAFTDNWVGEHPGQVFLGVVDAHPRPLFDYEDNDLRTRLQLHDAGFGKYWIRPKTFYLNEERYRTDWMYPSRYFSDSRTYWYADAPSSGIKVPEYGLKFRVLYSPHNYRKGKIHLSNHPVH